MRKFLTFLIAVVSIIGCSSIPILAADPLPPLTLEIVIQNTNSDPGLWIKSSAKTNMKDLNGPTMYRTVTVKVKIQDADGVYQTEAVKGPKRVFNYPYTPDQYIETKSNSTAQRDSKHTVIVNDGMSVMTDWFTWYVADSTQYTNSYS